MNHWLNKRRFYKQIVFIFLFMCVHVGLYAQGGTITGTVTDENQVPMPGANVIEIGTNNGTQTDFNGKFSLAVSNEDAILSISFVGFQTREISIEGMESIDISLKEDSNALEEVVVVGYGTQKKSDIVGSVGSVPSERLEQNNDPNLTQALQASVPGLTISRGSGEPGANGSINIRGINSISASSEPLVVLDGIPFSGSFNDINPNDVASVEVLKDASAAAIYGSRAASGVILVTTKRGTSGETVISLNSSWSIKNEAVPYEVMNAEQFFNLRREAYRTDGIITGEESDEEIAPIILEENELISWQRGESVDWLSEMLNENALRQEYQISVNSGNEDYRNYFSLSYLEDEGLEKNTGFNRGTLKNNLEILSIAPWLKFGNNFMFSYNDFDRVVFGLNNQPAFYRLSPFARIFEDDGSFTRFPQANDELLINPISEQELSSRENSFTNFFNNLYFEIAPEFLKGFSYRMNLGTTLRYNKSAIYWPRGTWLGDAVNGLAEVEKSRALDLTWENIINYSKSFGRHNVNLTGLYSRQSYDFERSGSGGSGFITDDLLWYNINTAENVLIPQSGGFPKNEWDLVSYMIRVNYNYSDKYYVTATARRDGYSGFAANRKYGDFPSIALAWRISEESFLNESPWLSELKLRTSYGTLGNQAVGTYRSLAQLLSTPHVFGETVVGGVRVNSLPNNELGWERATSLNLGTDFSLFDGKISGSMDYYVTNTSDLLLNREVPKITGQDNILYNVGEIENKGFELALNAFPLNLNDFTWKLSLNFSANRNEIIGLYGDNTDDVQNQWFIGEPLGVIYDFEFGGIWQMGQEDEIANSATPDRQPGEARIIDQNGDGELTAEDRVIVGDQNPDWTGGLSSTFSYKNFSLFIAVQTIQGLDRRLMEEGNIFGRFNRFPYDYWTPENPSNTWHRASLSNPSQPIGSIDVYDASFTRIKDITLAYNLPESILNPIGLDRVRINLNLHDYFTFTSFPFVDPESAAYARIGISKTALLGLNVSF